MRTFLECVPCFVRQTLDSARLVTDDETIHEQVLREVLREVGEMDFHNSPPVMGQHIHRLIRRLVADNDPYRNIKDRFNRLALALYPEIEKKLGGAHDPFETAVRLAIAGNIIDFGANCDLEDSHVEEAIESSLVAPLSKSAVEDLRESAGRATTILYLGDNAGEIVFDRLLIEQLPRQKVTYVVRGSPVINDATMSDALATGMTDLVEVIDNGSDAPGTILETCSAAFRRRFQSADLVIAKGQGNYETLSEASKSIHFLLKVKCPVIARHIGCDVDDLVVLRRP
jgi:uncharacterized protein with ATP-grasp and redox domains